MSLTIAGSEFAYNGRNGRQAGTLMMTERWWRDRYDDIVNRGYRLRPRYNPQLGPFWFETGKDLYAVESSQAITSRAAMDATRMRDGLPVVLKKVLPGDGPNELRINQLFSSEEHSRVRDNHCAPLLDVIELSGHSGSQKLMVFPLFRPFKQPRIQTLGEFAAFFTQICEGIRFMHQRNVAHRNFTVNNIMFYSSKTYPNGFHPAKSVRNWNFGNTTKAYNRTQRPPRYYFVDLCLSCQYPSRDAMDEPLCGGDDSAPEHRSGQQCNPFYTDIYYIGNIIRKEFVEKCNGFEFMEDLVARMTQVDPATRPPIEVVIEEFVHIRESLKLRSAITYKKEPKVFGIIRKGIQYVRSSWNAIFLHPAIPLADPYSQPATFLVLDS
ncbi:hypothetical protein H4582DRAFT_6109 [Lactarius indigo]|nr:hypothetical protein H4582DRAFT_6109 [Lactarius indigo]